MLSFSSADFSQLHKDGAGASSSSLKKSSATGGATSEMKTAMSASSSSGASMDFDAVNRKLLLELQASSSPELSFGDTVEHMVRLTREFFGVDRVGFFIVDKEKGILFLKVTQDGAGLKIPLKGIAGHIARTGQTVNIEDAYLDERFDPTMVSALPPSTLPPFIRTIYHHLTYMQLSCGALSIIHTTCLTDLI